MEMNWPTYASLLLGPGYAGPAPSKGGFEGGNDDDPQDPGGRTSRGILQREWNVFRRSHPGRPADVWQAPQSDVLAIYHDGQYWSEQRCPELPSGVDASTADYGVNSGVGRSGRVLRHIVGLPTNTYVINEDVVAAVKKRDADAVIDAINNERMAFLRSLGTFGRFGVGWTRRVNQIRSVSKNIAAKAPVPVPMPTDKVPGKAVHPEQKGVKNVIKGTATTGAGGGGFAMFDWVMAHPFEAAAIAIAIGTVVYFLVKIIDDITHTKNVTPMPGTPVVPEQGRPT